MINPDSKLFRPLLYLLVFFCGFANLSVEIIGPRLFASIFGNTTEIWAIIISVTLIGISIGYFIGGRINPKYNNRMLPFILIINAFWLIALSWIVWEIPSRVAMRGYSLIILIALLSFFIPSMLFSIVTPLAISISVIDQKRVGNFFAIGTIGSVAGALLAAFWFIPWVGLSNSLRIFAIVLVFFALIFTPKKLLSVSLISCFIVFFLPLPTYRWDSSLSLLAQVEGYYQTIRVYSDNSTFVRMHLGPTYETEMSLVNYEPRFGYAIEMVNLTGNVQGKKVLVIGGAGHSQARSLENRGAIVTEVEIDPLVVELSNRYFGEIRGNIVIKDGRAFLEQTGEKFDYILVDAYNGPASIPPQLTTKEFFEAVNNSLNQNGSLIYNFIGVPLGPKSNSYKAFSATLSSVFPYSYVSNTNGNGPMNLIFLGSQSPINVGYPQAPNNGPILTDDKNPIEIFFEEARSSVYFQK